MLSSSPSTYFWGLPLILSRGLSLSPYSGPKPSCMSGSHGNLSPTPRRVLLSIMGMLPSQGTAALVSTYRWGTGVVTEPPPNPHYKAGQRGPASTLSSAHLSPGGRSRTSHLRAAQGQTPLPPQQLVSVGGWIEKPFLSGVRPALTQTSGANYLVLSILSMLINDSD